MSAVIVMQADWPPRPESHCTLLYLGPVSEGQLVGWKQEELVRIIDETLPQNYLMADIYDFELFGTQDDGQVLVARVRSGVLSAIQEAVVTVLAEHGLGNASEFTEWKAHVTVEPSDVLSIPRSVMLAGPVVWWREDSDD